LPPAIEVQLKQRSIPDAIAIVASQETKEQTHSLKSRKNGRKKEENKNTFFQTFSSKDSKEKKKKPTFFQTLSLSLFKRQQEKERENHFLSNSFFKE
jgi:hypothetical protein